jgi:uncharacterized protein YhaN
MRLQRLDLRRYGHFTDRTIELPAGERDLHILFGPNEAGKSTALAAIEDLLFGIHPRSRYGFLHDYRDMRVGAQLEQGDERLEVVRRKGTSDTLLDADGLPLPGGEASLRPFLAGADRAFFTGCSASTRCAWKPAGASCWRPGTRSARRCSRREPGSAACANG